MPAQTNGLNELPRELYADGAAVMNTLQQIAGATGTALAITLMVSGQNSFLASFPDLHQLNYWLQAQNTFSSSLQHSLLSVLSHRYF